LDAKTAPQGVIIGRDFTHLASRSGPTVQATTIDHRPHRRIMRETLGVVHVLVAGKAPEHGLPQQPAQQMPRVPATAAFRQCAAGQIGQPERVARSP